MTTFYKSLKSFDSFIDSSKNGFLAKSFLKFNKLHLNFHYIINYLSFGNIG